MYDDLMKRKWLIEDSRLNAACRPVDDMVNTIRWLADRNSCCGCCEIHNRRRNDMKRVIDHLLNMSHNILSNP